MPLTAPIGPMRLPDNRVPVYYAGGAAISEFRALPSPVEGPEDWVGSLVALPESIRPRDADPRVGMSRLDDGRVLRDLVLDDPQGWLGPNLAGSFDGTSALLVKLLDAGERLPVHCHPSRDFARRHLDSIFGKTEGWIILAAERGASVWVGLERDVDRSTLARWIAEQDVSSMLAAMQRVDVAAGDVVYVPAGLPHAIGPGIMLTELQEPTSFSVLAEYEAFGLQPEAATLGLGWEVAQECFDLRSVSHRMTDILPQSTILHRSSEGTIESLFPQGSEDYFTALRVRVAGRLVLSGPSFSIAVVTDGEGSIVWDDGDTRVVRGDTLVIPFGAGIPEIVGNAELIMCLPPAGG